MSQQNDVFEWRESKDVRSMKKEQHRWALKMLNNMQWHHSGVKSATAVPLLPLSCRVENDEVAWEGLGRYKQFEDRV